VLRQVTEEMQPVLERLWQLYLHDLSEFRDSHPNEDGLFKREKLEPFLVPDHGHAAYLFVRDERPVGFALVSGVDHEPHWLDQFFVIRSMRGGGVGREAAAAVLRLHRGRWRIGFQNENPKAARFWRRLAAELGSDVREELQPVPGKPHIPDDVILSLTVS
jgi:predicted acetyltransferase